MTREEAINTLKDRIEQYTGGVHPSEREILLEALAVLRPTPDPITGLVPCGCGGEEYPHFQFGWTHEESGVQAFEVSIGCDDCGTYTKSRRGHYVNGIDEADTESASKRDWNMSHGYTATGSEELGVR